MLIGIMFVVIIIVIAAVAVFNPFLLSQVDTSIKNVVEPYIEEHTSSESAILKPIDLTYDIRRSADMNALQAALVQFRIEKGRYPNNLSELVPDYLPNVMTDPKTKEPYDYSLKNNGQSYQVCVEFKSQQRQEIPCISPD